MSIVRQGFVLEGSRGHRRVSTLVDTGSTECLVSPEIAAHLGEPDETPEPVKFDTSKKKNGLEARMWLPLNVRVNGQRHAAVFFVAEGLTEDAVIGAAFLQHHECRIDYRRKKLCIGKCCLHLRA
jgi:predicted aspartyl protease